MSTYADYREQRRADKAGDAEQARADRTAAHAARLQEIQVRAQLSERADNAAAERRRAEKELAKAAWVRRWAALKVWARDEAPATVVMGMPMLLAWSAMAAYGREIFGPLGVGLAAFSEGALLWFALEIPRAQKQDRPVGWLRVGLVVFGAVAAGLNAVHGLAMEGGGWDHAVVMAVVSVGGVAVHQLITAGPRVRRTRAQRRADRYRREVAREVARREHQAQLAAVRTAVAEIDDTGAARLIYRAGRIDPGTTSPAADGDAVDRPALDAAPPVQLADPVPAPPVPVQAAAVQWDDAPAVQPVDTPAACPAVQSEPVQSDGVFSMEIPAVARVAVTGPRAASPRPAVQAVQVEASASPARDRARAAARSHQHRTGTLPTVSELMDLAQVSRGTAGTALQELREQPADLHLVNDEDTIRNYS